MFLKLWYHSSESMISALHDIVDIRYHKCFYLWYHTSISPSPFLSFFWLCQRANKWVYPLDLDAATICRCGDEGWLRFLLIDQTRSAVLYVRAHALAGARTRCPARAGARARRATLTGVAAEAAVSRKVARKAVETRQIWRGQRRLLVGRTVVVCSLHVRQQSLVLRGSG